MIRISCNGVKQWKLGKLQYYLINSALTKYFLRPKISDVLGQREYEETHRTKSWLKRYGSREDLWGIEAQKYTDQNQRQ